MKEKLALIAARIREPSTLAGLSVLGVLLGLPPGTLDAVAQVLAGAVAVGAIMLPEGK